MATVTSSGGYNIGDPAGWPEWVVWYGPWPGDPRLASLGEDIGGDPKAATDHTHRVRRWLETNLPRPYPWRQVHAEWERRHPGIPYRSREASAMIPHDLPPVDD